MVYDGAFELLFCVFCRQKSLPSASSEISLPETQLDWVDQLDIDGETVTLRKKKPASYESVEGLVTYFLDTNNLIFLFG